MNNLIPLILFRSYKLRIESMLLKEEFMANQEFLESSIETIRCAVQGIFLFFFSWKLLLKENRCK